MDAAAEERAELEHEVAAIISDLKRIIRARDRRRRRRMRRQLAAEATEIPKWGRRRLRSVLEDAGKPAAAGVAERDGAASPDTPLAFPDSLVPEEEEDDAAKKARAQDEWVQEQRGVVASLSQEKADLLKQIEEYRARLQTSRCANESLKQLHKVRQQREQEQARKMRMRALRQGTTPTLPPASSLMPVVLVLDLNEPARAPDGDEEAAAMARARAAAEQFWQAQQRVAQQKAAATAEARRRRLGILRAKVASPLLSSRTRRVAG